MSGRASSEAGKGKDRRKLTSPRGKGVQKTRLKVKPIKALAKGRSLSVGNKPVSSLLHSSGSSSHGNISNRAKSVSKPKCHLNVIPKSRARSTGPSKTRSPSPGKKLVKDIIRGRSPTKKGHHLVAPKAVRSKSSTDNPSSKKDASKVGARSKNSPSPARSQSSDGQAPASKSSIAKTDVSKTLSRSKNSPSPARDRSGGAQAKERVPPKKRSGSVHTKTSGRSVSKSPGRSSSSGKRQKTESGNSLLLTADKKRKRSTTPKAPIRRKTGSEAQGKPSSQNVRKTKISPSPAPEDHDVKKGRGRSKVKQDGIFGCKIADQKLGQSDTVITERKVQVKADTSHVTDNQEDTTPGKSDAKPKAVRKVKSSQNKPPAAAAADADTGSENIHLTAQLGQEHNYSTSPDNKKTKIAKKIGRSNKDLSDSSECSPNTDNCPPDKQTPSEESDVAVDSPIKNVTEQTDADSLPQKKADGKPKKGTSISSPAMTVKNEVATSMAPANAPGSAVRKKSAGRPRKKPLLQSPMDKTEQGTNEGAQPERRTPGRKKQVGQKQEPMTKVEADQTPVSGAKRGVGRPRKNSGVTTDPVTKDDPSVQDVEMTQIRGRRRSGRGIKDDDADSVTTAAYTSAEDNEDESVPVKRGPGRPRVRVSASRSVSVDSEIKKKPHSRRGSTATCTSDGEKMVLDQQPASPKDLGATAKDTKDEDLDSSGSSQALMSIFKQTVALRQQLAIERQCWQKQGSDGDEADPKPTTEAASVKPRRAGERQNVFEMFSCMDSGAESGEHSAAEDGKTIETSNKPRRQSRDSVPVVDGAAVKPKVGSRRSSVASQVAESGVSQKPDEGQVKTEDAEGKSPVPQKRKPGRPPRRRTSTVGRTDTQSEMDVKPDTEAGGAKFSDKTGDDSKKLSRAEIMLKARNARRCHKKKPDIEDNPNENLPQSETSNEPSSLPPEVTVGEITKECDAMDTSIEPDTGMVVEDPQPAELLVPSESMDIDVASPEPEPKSTVMHNESESSQADHDKSAITPEEPEAILSEPPRETPPPEPSANDGVHLANIPDVSPSSRDMMGKTTPVIPSVDSIGTDEEHVPPKLPGSETSSDDQPQDGPVSSSRTATEDQIQTDKQEDILTETCPANSSEENDSRIIESTKEGKHITTDDAAADLNDVPEKNSAENVPDQSSSDNQADVADAKDVEKVPALVSSAVVLESAAEPCDKELSSTKPQMEGSDTDDRLVISGRCDDEHQSVISNVNAEPNKIEISGGKTEGITQIPGTGLTMITDEQIDNVESVHVEPKTKSLGNTEEFSVASKQDSDYESPSVEAAKCEVCIKPTEQSAQIDSEAEKSVVDNNSAEVQEEPNNTTLPEKMASQKDVCADSNPEVEANSKENQIAEIAAAPMPESSAEPILKMAAEPTPEFVAESTPELLVESTPDMAAALSPASVIDVKDIMTLPGRTVGTNQELFLESKFGSDCTDDVDMADVSSVHSSSMFTDKDSTPEPESHHSRRAKMKRRSELDLLNDVDGSVSRRKKSRLFQKAYELYGEKGLIDNSLAKTLERPGKFDAENASRTQLIEAGLTGSGEQIQSNGEMKVATRGKQNRFSHLFKKRKREGRPQSPITATGKPAKMTASPSMPVEHIDYSQLCGNLEYMVRYCKPCSVKLVDLIKCLDVLKEKEKSEKKKQVDRDVCISEGSKAQVQRSRKRKISDRKTPPPNTNPDTKKESPPAKSILTEKSSYENEFLSFLQGSPESVAPQKSEEHNTEDPSTSVLQAEKSTTDRDNSNEPRWDSTVLITPQEPEQNLSGKRTSTQDDKTDPSGGEAPVATQEVLRRSKRPTMKTLYRCLFCRYTCHIRKIMEDHVYNHMDVIPYMCGLCYAIFGTRGGVLVHNRRSHKGHQPIIIKKSDVDETQYYTTLPDFIEKYGDVDSVLPERYIDAAMSDSWGSQTSHDLKDERSRSLPPEPIVKAPTPAARKEAKTTPATSCTPLNTSSTQVTAVTAETNKSNVTTAVPKVIRKKPLKEAPVVRPKILPKGTIPMIPMTSLAQAQMPPPILLQLPASQGLHMSGAPVFLVAQSSGPGTAPVLTAVTGTQVARQVSQQIPLIQVQSTPGASPAPAPTAAFVSTSGTPSKEQAVSEKTQKEEQKAENSASKEKEKAVSEESPMSEGSKASEISVNTENKEDAPPPKRSPIILRIPKIHQWKKDYVESSDEAEMSTEESDMDHSQRQASVARSLESGQSDLEIVQVKETTSASEDTLKKSTAPAEGGTNELVIADVQVDEADNSSNRSGSSSPMLKIVSVCSLATQDETVRPSTDPVPPLNTNKATATEMLENLNTLICPSEVHADIEADEVWQCNFCDENTRLYDVMVGHIQHAHRKTYWYACPYCPFGCSQPRFNMYRHMRRTHPNKDDSIFVGIIDADKYFTKQKIGKGLPGTLESKNPVLEHTYKSPGASGHSTKTEKVTESKTIKVSPKKNKEEAVTKSTTGSNQEKNTKDNIENKKNDEEVIFVSEGPPKKPSKPTAHVAPAIQSKPVVSPSWTDEPMGATVPVYIPQAPDMGQQEGALSQDELSMECENVDEPRPEDSVEEDEGEVESITSRPTTSAYQSTISTEQHIDVMAPSRDNLQQTMANKASGKSSPLKATVSPSIIPGQSSSKQVTSSSSGSTSDTSVTSTNTTGAAVVGTQASTAPGAKPLPPPLIPLGIVEASQVTGRKRTEVPPLRRAPMAKVSSQTPRPAHQGSPHIVPSIGGSIVHTVASAHIKPNMIVTPAMSQRPINTTLPIRGAAVRPNRPVSAVSGTRPVPSLSEEEEARRAFSVFNISARMRNPPMRHRPPMSVPQPPAAHIPRKSASVDHSIRHKIASSQPDMQQFKQFQLPPARGWMPPVGLIGSPQVDYSARKGLPDSRQIATTMMGSPQVDWNKSSEVSGGSHLPPPPMAHRSHGVIRTMPRLAPAPVRPPTVRLAPPAPPTDGLSTHTLWTCPYCTVPNQMTKSFVEKHIRNCHPSKKIVYIPFNT